MIMKRLFLFISLLAALAVTGQERIEPVPFGDMEQWVVRYIKESRIIGGKTRVLYAIAPTDTIRKNVAFDYEKSGSPWTVSSAYARVKGIEKASGTVSPERRGKGWCCRLDNKMDSVIAIGLFKVRVMVAGTIFTGVTLEPVTSAEDPYGVVDMGVAFTKRPIAMMLDYKAKVEEKKVVMPPKCTSFSNAAGRTKTATCTPNAWQQATSASITRQTGRTTTAYPFTGAMPSPYKAAIKTIWV